LTVIVSLFIMGRLLAEAPGSGMAANPGNRTDGRGTSPGTNIYPVGCLEVVLGHMGRHVVVTTATLHRASGELTRFVFFALEVTDLTANGVLR